MTDPAATPDTTVKRIFTALLVIGVSGAGKTSLLATLAEYLWETHQKILLLYSWDGGAIPTRIQVRMQQGLIRFWRVRTRSASGLALDNLALATKGYWPRSIDPRTGETTPAVDLVAPVTTRYEISDKSGKLLKTVPSAALIKPFAPSGSTVMLQVSDMQIKEVTGRTKGFESVGGVAYDGISSMTQVVLDHMDKQRGLGLIGGEKSSFGGVVTSGPNTKYGGNNRADVGFAQTRAAEYVANTLSIPYLVESPVFTGLSTEGTDKGGLSIVGVDLPGQAALTQAPQWFGNICEADTVIDEDGHAHYALNLTKFTDKQGRTHLLKTSASPWGVPDRLIDPAKGEGEPFSEFNLGKLFRLLDEDLKRSLAEAQLEGPGLPAGMLEVGEPERIETPAIPHGAVRPSGGPVPPSPPAVQAGTRGPVSAPPSVSKPPAPAGQPAAPIAIAPPAVSTPTTIPKVPTGNAPPPPGRPPARAPGK